MKTQITILASAFFGLMLSLSVAAMEPDQGQALLSRADRKRLRAALENHYYITHRNPHNFKNEDNESNEPEIELNRPSNNQAQLYLCTYIECGKRFAALNLLQRHLASHENKRNFICSTCGAGFNYSYHLKSHEEKVHAEHRECLCDRCGFAFKRQSDLSKHLREVKCKSPKYLHRMANKMAAIQNNATPPLPAQSSPQKELLQ